MNQPTISSFPFSSNSLNQSIPVPIRALALDLDKTTLLPEGTLSDVTRQTLLAVMEKGIEVIVASGRPLKALPKDILELSGIRYAVTSNGAAVYDIRTEECIHRSVLEEESVLRILELTLGKDMIFEAIVGGICYAERCYVENPMQYGATRQGAVYVPKTRTPIQGMRDFIYFHRKKLDSIDLILSSDEEREEWRCLFDREVPMLYQTTSVTRLLELSHRDGGKHSGVKLVLERLGISPGETAAFGDAENDIELLRFAGIGIAMENASENCKEAADAVTKSNVEDGVAWAIHQFLGL